MSVDCRCCFKMNMGLILKSKFSAFHHEVLKLPRQSLKLPSKVAKENIDIQPQDWPGGRTSCDEKNEYPCDHLVKLRNFQIHRLVAM